MEPATPAHLVYCDDSLPGITRRKRGKSFQYFTPDGARITDETEIARLNAIALPPAYDRCWYCPDANGHIQATGHDARGRKQYRYHADFRAAQEEGKFALCPQFGEALPAMRARVEAALRVRSPSRERTLAALVRLLDIGMVRIGNGRYEKDNGSYGATTLKMRHARIEGGRLRLRYRGKSGQMRDMAVRDAGLLRFVRAMQDLPGQRLFQWLDEAGGRHEIGSAEVNAYIRETMGAPFSAKHFRTWGGTLTAFSALVHAPGPLPLKALLEEVAQALGNTPAIARKSYIHPAVIALAGNDGAPLPRLPRASRWLSREERGLIAFLAALEPGAKAAA